MKEISDELYQTLEYLGIIDNEVRNHNVGKSNYADNVIQPWTIWRAYPHLSSFDHDIIKRILREKEGDSRRMDYEKIIHICQECIRAIDVVEKYKKKEKPLIQKGKQYLCIKDFSADLGDRMGIVFTNGFYYNSPKDNYLYSNDGMMSFVSDSFFNEHFRITNE